MAISIASYLAPELGSRLKQLRPETPMRELLGWLNTSLGGEPNSLEWVEFFIALEEELRCRIDDAFAEKLEQSTFGELVEHLHKNQRSAA